MAARAYCIERMNRSTSLRRVLVTPLGTEAVLDVVPLEEDGQRVAERLDRLRREEAGPPSVVLRVRPLDRQLFGEVHAGLVRVDRDARLQPVEAGVLRARVEHVRVVQV